MTGSARFERRPWLVEAPGALYTLICDHGGVYYEPDLGTLPLVDRENEHAIVRLCYETWREVYRCGCTVPAQLGDDGGRFGEGGAG